VVRLVGCINDELAMILIDPGSSHKFQSQEMVDKSKLQQVKTKVNTILFLMMVLGPLIVECSKP
jgi:hypothetical protein